MSKIEKSHLKNKSNITVGTLSFPVCSGRTFRNNSDVISTIIRLRKPGLLLCAGWSIPSKKSLHLIQNATHHSRTVVVLETKKPKMVWRVAAGRLHQMGRQQIRDSGFSEPALASLAGNFSDRKFSIWKRQVLLLICGEITILRGRKKGVTFQNPLTPASLKDAIQQKSALILNPTHTRMGNAGTIRAWRKFLSANDRLYLSASNWDISSEKKQRPSETIHEFWYGGEEQTHCFCSKQDCFFYREWRLPYGVTAKLNNSLN